MKKYILKLLDDDIATINSRIFHIKKSIERMGSFQDYHEKSLNSAENKLKRIIRYRERIEHDMK